jgi:putative membrane protein
MLTRFYLGAVAVIALTDGTAAFAPVAFKVTGVPALASRQSHMPQHSLTLRQTNENTVVSLDEEETPSPLLSWGIAAVPGLLTLFMSLPAEAAVGAAPFASAVAAYVHYVSLLVIAGCITVERVTVKAGMSQEDQALMTNADITLGISGLALAVSGYYRVVQYGKGFDFYAHEPVFWLKIALVGVFGALSFFPTTKIIQRSVQKQQSEDGMFPEMSEALASRMKSILNAEITALLSIPLSATIMSRGIGYSDSIPWPAEAALASLVFAGLGFKYVKEALDFQE